MKGSLRARGKDVWQLTIDLGKDPQEKRLRQYLTIKGNKGTAERKKRELLASLDLGLPIDNNKVTVSQFLEDWLQIKSDFLILRLRPCRRPHIYNILYNIRYNII